MARRPGPRLHWHGQASDARGVCVTLSPLAACARQVEVGEVHDGNARLRPSPAAAHGPVGFRSGIIGPGFGNDGRCLVDGRRQKGVCANNDRNQWQAMGWHLWAYYLDLNNNHAGSPASQEIAQYTTSVVQRSSLAPHPTTRQLSVRSAHRSCVCRRHQRPQ